MTIMDIYLPADFYALREGLDDWRDVGTSVEPDPSSQPHSHPMTEPNGCADPNWRVF
jgi:hypothetical protein